MVPLVSPPRKRGSSTDRRAPFIVFADDSLDARTMYGEYLVEAGYQVATAADGNEAVKLALTVAPELIVMDMQMPGLDGWEAARLMQSYRPTRPIPIIALSGHHDAVSVQRAMAAGCSRFVRKPCAPEELVRNIESTLRHQES